MLITASLIDKEGLTRMQGNDRLNLMKNMDLDSECITLTTSMFDSLPPEALKSLKKGMEIVLGRFGHLCLGLLAVGLTEKDTMNKVSNIFDEGLNVLETGLEKLIKKQ